jgi:TPR repeat protein
MTMDGWEDLELYLTLILFIATVALTMHTYRYYKAKKRIFKDMKRFAKEGDADASVYVAEEYRKGDIVKKSCDKALFWYVKAACDGSEEAKRKAEMLKKEEKK